ncbi:SDR family NAD(P)-dependent oxidoreductase [uncultured Paracoccus sp.]|uniref:SDR family NAD(P)-dependent oxidoreductase n=1 Tax=uncultured Paracoccus sp. TaxID=189685 RepID=UPI002622CBF0|nr:SDR family NAD(P)-dependent oxidoreductase [uncultured Paracoccus sp.]
MSFSLAGKTIVITGAAGGIGAEIATICASLGAALVLADRETPGAVADRLAASGAEVTTAAFDVRDREATEALIDGLPKLDGVVANAGWCPWDDWADENWDAVFRDVTDVNVLGVINLMRPALTRMTKSGGGRAVILASVAGRMGGLKAAPHYVAAKGGVIAMTKWMARKAAPYGVTVNAVAPGATATSMTAGQEFDNTGIPLRRVAHPREIAWPVAFLLSDAASYICGTTLDVNGGVYMN